MERDVSTELMDVLVALHHPTRRWLAELLWIEGPATVGRLAARTGLAVGSVSHHLKPLHQQGFIEPAPELARHYASHGALSAAHEYQHERFGGFKVGSAFFGWLVAVGLTVLLAALASLVVRLTGISPNLAAAPGQDPRMLGITGGIVAVVVMLLAYVAGGYVAGRLARFDGARNGFAVWAMGVVVTAAVTIAIAVTGTTEPLFAALRVPGIALSGSSLSWSSAIAIVVVAAVALVGAIAGGKAGESYHRRVDRAAEKAL